MPAAADSMGVEASSVSGGEQSVTAMDYINRQLELEKEAREIMPYSFETCTYSMGPLRQPVYACKAHSPEGGALCYSCSISCHGDCDLVELFNKRNIQCDCGTVRFPNSPCTLRNNITNDTSAETNKYCHNYQGRFCACDRDYDVAKETGTMYQCLLGDACNEDWFHDVCIVGEKYPEDIEDEPVKMENGAPGPSEVEVKVDKPIEDAKHETLTEEGSVINGITKEATAGTTTEATSNGTTSAPANRDSQAAPALAGDEEDEYDDDEPPPGFPASSTFTNFICWLCVAKNPWLRNYAGTPGFLPAVVKKDAILSPPVESTTTITVTTTITTTIETSTTITPQHEHASPSSDQLPSKKRKASDDGNFNSSIIDVPALKRVNKNPSPEPTETTTNGSSSHPTTTKSAITTTITPETFPAPSPIPPTSPVSLFLTSPPHTLPPTTFCRCPIHLPLLAPFPILTSTEEEPSYEPPLSRSASPTGSHHSILDMGERVLSTMDRVKAIEGVMAYNHMKEKVREFLKPFAEGGGVVGAEDVRAYFEKLRGEGNGGGKWNDGGSGSGSGSNRKEQPGY
ncbi:hypothetical protein L211DRAFT_826602 [Terfezia boudieri ATCC MYA-4762]|uniref:UBR-type domain-containing protein n=1 Tax=Terfezia boudieri ATCC MYA-4762 TaxID=1051890 RepID=A0A3N4LIH0_9PEZI|nr:hypothetical protein L211DRAFT_826602 [Terfezia boudieri ATCC MYA-4762]